VISVTEAQCILAHNGCTTTGHRRSVQEVAMIVASQVFSIAAPARKPTWLVLLAGVYAIVEKANHLAAMRRARLELLALPDVMLSDIGISRSDITSVVTLGRTDRTRHSRG
jgi:uncharacterized protein YjiS (DUF1127 family)